MKGELPRGFRATTMLLATAIHRGTWTVEDLQRRIRGLFTPRPQGKWVLELAEETFLAFPPNRPRPRLQVLYRFVLAATGWREFGQRQRKAEKPSRVRPSQILPPLMQPVLGSPSSWPVPALTNAGQLADWLGLTCRELDWFADCPKRLAHEPEGPVQHYRYLWVPKRAGGKRLLEAPKSRLKDIQRQLLENILDEIPPHHAAHAYRRGRSLATYLAPHAGQGVVIHLDLCDFFTSVRWPTIHALFRTVGYPENVARLLTGLCLNVTPLSIINASGLELDSCHSPQLMALRLAHLPQGAPSSPALANLAAYRLDCRLSGLARKMAREMKLRYSRYADDLVFSGDQRLVRSLTPFLDLVRKILLAEGFSMRGHKTRVMVRATRQQVSGVTLNEHPNLPRRDFDQVRAMLFNCIRFGPTSQNRENHPHFRDHLQGKIGYWTLINPERGAKLKALFDQIEWSESKPLYTLRGED